MSGHVVQPTSHWPTTLCATFLLMCLLVDKTLIGHAPDYICDLFTLVADMPSRSSVHASSSGNLFLSRMEQRFGDRAFSVVAPGVWNRLPTELTLMCSSTTTFKCHDILIQLSVHLSLTISCVIGLTVGGALQMLLLLLVLLINTAFTG